MNDLRIASEPDETALARTRVEIEGLGTITVISAEALARQSRLIAERSAFPPVTMANLVEADRLVGAIAVHDRDVEARREGTKRPFLEAGRFVDAAAKDATIGRVDRATGRDLLGEVSSVRRMEEQRIAAETAERDRIAAEAEAAVARARQIAEESAKAIAELEATATPSEAASLAELRAEAHVAASAAQAEAIDLGGRAWVASATAGSRVMPKLATNSRKVMRLVIDDASKVPHKINGLELTKPIDANISKLLRAGVAVPGCRLVEVDEATAGRR